LLSASQEKQLVERHGSSEKDKKTEPAKKADFKPREIAKTAGALTLRGHWKNREIFSGV